MERREKIHLWGAAQSREIFAKRMGSTEEKARVWVVSQRRSASHLQGYPLTLGPDISSGGKWSRWACILELDS